MKVHGQQENIGNSMHAFASGENSVKSFRDVCPQQQSACMRHSGRPADFPGRREVKCKEMCPRGKEQVSVALPWSGLMKNEFGILGVTTARSD